jgi:hypothetical protein
VKNTEQKKIEESNQVHFQFFLYVYPTLPDFVMRISVAGILLHHIPEHMSSLFSSLISVGWSAVLVVS